MKHTLITITAVLLLIGCGDNNKRENKEVAKKTETFKTVQYYLDHKDLRKVRLAECKNMQEMTEIIMHDCNNAKTAEYKSHKNKHMEF